MPDIKLLDDVHEFLECPKCHASLQIKESDLFCVDRKCGMKFPVVNGVPVLINDNNSVFSLNEFLQGSATFFKPENLFTAKVKRLTPSISKNLVAKANYERLRRLLLDNPSISSRPRILVLGGSILGDGFEDLANNPDIDLIETDVSWGPRTKIICDAHDIPFSSDTFDAVIAQAVLEHVADPFRCVSEIWRVLKPEGLVYAETAFMQQVHGGAYDFMRFTPVGHRSLFRHFIEIESGVACGPGMALAWSWRHFLRSFCTGRRARLFMTMFSHITGFIFKYVDRFTINNPIAAEGAAALWFLGSKAQSAISNKDIIKQYRAADR
jgi:SAM-dependent methyltransferase